jgi:alkanesulfonate monooxygenase SsuD/methylene tetrahydromethanopterin reductase-like flavin-dependent oxidoreductase (luciferase family)
MKIAVWDTFQPRDGITPSEQYRQRIKEIQHAEACGFQHYWFLEHHLSPMSPLPSPNLLIAAAAHATSRIRLGNMVNILPFRNPLLLAQEIAMLDNLTDGRLDTGIGRGLKPTEFDSYGLSQADSRAMFLESIEIMIGVWTQEKFARQGKYFTVNKTTPLAPGLVQRPYPPLYVSAQSEESLRWAAERDVPFGQIDALPEECKAAVTFYHEVQVAAGHRPEPRLFLTREVFVGADDAKAREEAYPYLLSYWDLWHRYSQFTRDGRMPDSYDVWRKRAPRLSAMSYDELVDSNMILVGGPERVAAQLRALCAEIEIDTLTCVFHLGKLSHERVKASMSMFADEVLPRLGLARAAQ